MMMNQGTMVTVTWQIVSGLRQSHSFRGGSDYPYPFDQFVNVIEVVMLDFFTFFHAECVARTTFADKLMASLLVLASLGIISTMYGAIYTRIYGGTVLRSSSVKGYILLIYIVLPIMSSMAFSAFNVDRVSEGQHQLLSNLHLSSTHHPLIAIFPGSTIAGKAVARRT